MSTAIAAIQAQDNTQTATATNPSTRLNVLASFAPATRIAPTTAIAEIALVRDINGV